MPGSSNSSWDLQEGEILLAGKLHNYLLHPGVINVAPCEKNSKHSRTENFYPWKGLLQGWPLGSIWKFGFERVFTILKIEKRAHYA